MTERVQSLLPRLAPLLRQGDQLIWPGEAKVDRSLVGRAWCPTRWALERMEKAGVRIPKTPGIEVLRRVNHRRFNHQLGQHLPGAGYAETEAELDALLAGKEGWWLFKRALGYAGRGRKRFRPGELDRSWIEASLRTGDGLQVEPLVERVIDCALHGFVDENGKCMLGQPTIQELDSSGAWIATRVATSELTHDERDSLHREAALSAKALHHSGYFGPFGIDGFRWRGQERADHFQPRCEINARYSMGWAIGMGDARPD
jgi:phosphoribosylaminoimidazole carboxylase (NCAIR synthetase)